METITKAVIAISEVRRGFENRQARANVKSAIVKVGGSQQGQLKKSALALASRPFV
jgi:hypothetical protein